MARKSYRSRSYSATRPFGVRTPSENVVCACRLPRSSTASANGLRGDDAGGRPVPRHRKAQRKPAVDFLPERRLRTDRGVRRRPAREAVAAAALRRLIGARERLDEGRIVLDARAARIDVGVGRPRRFVVERRRHHARFAFGGLARGLDLHLLGLGRQGDQGQQRRDDRDQNRHTSILYQDHTLASPYGCGCTATITGSPRLTAAARTATITGSPRLRLRLALPLSPAQPHEFAD